MTEAGPSRQTHTTRSFRFVTTRPAIQPGGFMYGQLQYKPENTQAPWTVSFFLFSDLARPNLSPQQLGDRGRALAQLRTEMRLDIGPELDALLKIANGMPGNTGDVLSDLYLALAHLRLEPAKRLARETQITSVLDDHFKDTPDIACLKAGITHIKLMAPLVPDAYLDCLLHSQAGRLNMVAISDPIWAIFNTPMLAELTAVVENGLGFKE
eukprot:gene17610-36148_t